MFYCRLCRYPRNCFWHGRAFSRQKCFTALKMFYCSPEYVVTRMPSMTGSNKISRQKSFTALKMFYCSPEYVVTPTPSMTGSKKITKKQKKKEKEQEKNRRTQDARSWMLHSGTNAEHGRLRFKSVRSAFSWRQKKKNVVLIVLICIQNWKYFFKYEHGRLRFKAVRSAFSWRIFFFVLCCVNLHLELKIFLQIQVQVR